jgi:hypothetical protein
MHSIYSNEVKEELKKEIEKNKDASKYESFYLKSVFPDLRLGVLTDKELFHYHFILMHHLYLLQEEWELKNKYLHVHFMRIQLFDYPKLTCRYFDTTEMKFCENKIIESSNSHYCELHSSIQLENISKKVFYLDSENINFYQDLEFIGFSKITQKFVFENKKVMDAFTILELEPTFDFNVIKKAFREQAILTHPDKEFGNIKKFKELNNAYRFLEFIVK